MHYHHHTSNECEAPHGWPDWVLTLFATFKHLEVQLMAQQDQINTDVAAIGDALNSLAQEITDLKGQISAQVPASVDLSGLDALAEKAKSLVPAPAAAPADNTGTLSASGSDTTAPTDGTGVNPAPTL